MISVTGESRTLPGRHYVLGLLTFVYVFNFADRQILAILLQPIKEELLLSDTQLGFLSGIAFALFYVTLGLPIARLADRKKRVNIIAVSIAIWSLMTAVCGFATSFFQLLLARIGVGIGEAGCTPPAHSLISDYFRTEERSAALGVYSLGMSVGGFLGILLGGWIAELYGWRMAFFVVAVPGIFLAVLVKLTIKEPARGMADGVKSDSGADGEDVPAFLDVLRFLWARKSFRHATLGTSLLAATGFGSATWLPPFLYRVHGMSLGEIGTWLALITVVGGATGTMAGGFFGGRLIARDVRWHVWLPGIVMLAGIPFSIIGLLAGSKYLALGMFLIPTFLHSMYVGPTMALIQRQAPLRMRAMAVAVFFFFTNLIGMGGGPLLIGFISDMMTASFAENALRYALLSMMVFTVWSGLHYLWAARYVTRDLGVLEGTDVPAHVQPETGATQQQE